MDLRPAASNLGLELDEFMEIVKLFVDTAAEDIEKLQVACKNQDAEQVKRVAHALKGSSGNLGFMEFSEIARKAEQSAHGSAFQPVAAAIPELQRHLENIRQGLAGE